MKLFAATASYTFTAVHACAPDGTCCFGDMNRACDNCCSKTFGYADKCDHAGEGALGVQCGGPHKVKPYHPPAPSTKCQGAPVHCTHYERGRASGPVKRSSPDPIGNGPEDCCAYHNHWILDVWCHYDAVFVPRKNKFSDDTCNIYVPGSYNWTSDPNGPHTRCATAWKNASSSSAREDLWSANITLV